MTRFLSERTRCWVRPLLALFVVLAGIGSLTSAAPNSRFRFWDMPTPGSLICDVAIGPDGAEWGEEIAGNNLVRIDEKTGRVDEYAIPFTVPPLDVRLPTIPGTNRPVVSCALQTAPNGLLYASNGFRNQVVVMNVSTKVIEVYTSPDIAGNLYPLDDLTPAPTALYYTQSTGNVITRFDYKTHAFKNYKVPTPLAQPIGIYYASDGGVWFLEFRASKVGRLDPKTGKIIEYQLPPALYGPQVMRAETQKRYLWFMAAVGGSLGRIDLVTHKITAYRTPSPLALPVENCPASNGDIWFTYLLKNKLGRFRPSTGKFIEVDEPGDINAQTPISVDPFIGNGIYCKPGNNVWFSQSLANRIGRYSLD